MGNRIRPSHNARHKGGPCGSQGLWCDARVGEGVCACGRQHRVRADGARVSADITVLHRRGRRAVPDIAVHVAVVLFVAAVVRASDDPGLGVALLPVAAGVPVDGAAHRAIVAADSVADGFVDTASVAGKHY